MYGCARRLLLKDRHWSTHAMEFSMQTWRGLKSCECMSHLGSDRDLHKLIHGPLVFMEAPVNRYIGRERS